MPRQTTAGLLHRELTSKILDAFFQVHFELGHGFLESIYSRALQHVLKELGLQVVREAPIDVFFRGECIGRFKADQVVESAVLVELKAGEHLDPTASAQVLNYLRSTRLEVGLLLHFGVKPRFQRFLYTNDRKLLP